MTELIRELVRELERSISDWNRDVVKEGYTLPIHSNKIPVPFTELHRCVGLLGFRTGLKDAIDALGNAIEHNHRDLMEEGVNESDTEAVAGELFAQESGNDFIDSLKAFYSMLEEAGMVMVADVLYAEMKDEELEECHEVFYDYQMLLRYKFPIMFPCFAEVDDSVEKELVRVVYFSGYHYTWSRCVREFVAESIRGYIANGYKVPNLITISKSIINNRASVIGAIDDELVRWM